MIKHYFAAYTGLPRPVYALFAARLINSLGYFVAPLLTLILTQKLGMDKADTGEMVALLLLTQAPCVQLGGWLADRYGRKMALMGGSAAGAALYLACGVAFWRGLPGPVMLGCMILAADCVAVAVPASDALVAESTRPEERQAAYSLLYLGINVGMAVSPLVGGLLFQNHLSLLFALDAATTLASVAVVARLVPETHGKQTYPHRAKMSDDASLSPDAAEGEGKRDRLAPLLAAFLFLLFFYDFCYSQWNFLLPAQLGDLYGADGARRYSLLTTINAVTVLALTPLVTRLARGLRPLQAMALAGLAFLAAYLGFAAGGSYGLDLALAVVFTLGEIGLAVHISAFVAEHAHPGRLARTNAFATLLRGAAAALGPLCMGKLLAASGYAVGWGATAGITLAAAAGYFLLDCRVGKQQRGPAH